LNGPPGGSRRLGAVSLDLERARAVAHAHAAKINDVLLTVVAGGVRELLIGRKEPVSGLELRVSVPANLRRSGARDLGNAVGAMVVGLPAGEPDAVRRLERIAAATRAAKVAQHPAYVEGSTAGLAAAGLLVPFARRQRLVNLFVTNVPGPAAALYLLGARIDRLMPIVMPAGNVTVIVAALSYRGQLDVVVDAAGCDDLGVLVAGMERAWAALAA